jgi:hypothetical protein
MSAPNPQNDEEAGYAAYALVDALVALLLDKQIIGRSELIALLEVVQKRLAVTPNHGSNRAANLIGAWISRESDIKE